LRRFFVRQSIIFETMNILTRCDGRIAVGHRGNRAHAPENTIESFAQAIAAGADAIEFDVHVTADGIPVVHHDRTVTRTTDGAGEIARLTFDELRRFDAGANFTKDGGKSFPYRGMGHRIPLFEEVVEAFPSTPLLIELKTALAATEVRRILEQRLATERVLIDSFRPEALRVFRGSGIATGASRDGIASLAREAIGGRAANVDFQAVCTPLSYYGVPLPVKRVAGVAKKYGVPVHVWTINETAVANDLWLAGVTGIITDDPALMLRLRSRMPLSADLLR
jgi:glycerophosphoryl diester phosphodiesterase